MIALEIRGEFKNLDHPPWSSQGLTRGMSGIEKNGRGATNPRENTGPSDRWKERAAILPLNRRGANMNLHTQLHLRWLF
jgi:hypothetical protein